MSRILVFQHSDRCGPGRLGRVLAEHGRRLVIVRPDRDGAGVVPRDLHDIEGVVSLGGPMNISDGLDWLNAEMAFLKRAHEASIPMVGICLGHQAIATALGGRVGAMAKPEIGFLPIDLTHAAQNDPVFGGMPWSAPRFSSHGYEVTDMPPGAVLLASSAACKVQSYRIGSRTYAFQYHFEWTREQIGNEDEEFLRASGVTLREIDEQCATHYARFDEIATRQCQNLAHLLLR